MQGFQALHNRAKLKFWIWFFFESILPAATVILMWPIAKYFVETDNAFEKVLSNENLLPLSSMVLIATVLNISFDENIKKDNGFFQFSLVFAAFLACVFLFVYGFMRSASFEFDYSSIGANGDDSRMVLFGKISLASISIAWLLSVFVKAIGTYLLPVNPR